MTRGKPSRRPVFRPSDRPPRKGRCGKCGTSCTYVIHPQRSIWVHDEPGHGDHDPNTYIERTAVCSRCGKTEVSDHGDDQRFLCRDCV